MIFTVWRTERDLRGISRQVEREMWFNPDHVLSVELVSGKIHMKLATGATFIVAERWESVIDKLNYGRRPT